MQLLILGTTGDDKGTQLEKLTGVILKKLGYTNIVTNQVNAGADELDLTAEYIQPGIGQPIVQKVIVECKAYNKPVSLPDWLKFLGKLFTAELGKVNVQGCFIALSGSNGNVMGHYSNVKRTRGDIQLLSGESLLNAIREPYQLKPAEDILDWVAAQTKKQVINTSLCYYNDLFYWLIAFQESQFTILNHDGDCLKASEATVISELLQKETDSLTYIDLQTENEKYERAVTVSKSVLAVFMDNENALSSTAVLKKTILGFSTTVKNINKHDIELALKNLSNNQIIVKKRTSYSLIGRQSTATTHDILKVYRFALVKELKLVALKSKFYQDNINRNLFEAVLDLQGGVKIPDENINEYLQILKWSPSALNYAINPDPFLHEHRNRGMTLTDALEEHDTVHFIRQLYQNFTHDFGTQGFTDYLFKECMIKEMETVVTTKIKGEKELLYENTSIQRLAFADMEINGKKIPIVVSVLGDQPETWDWGKTHQDTIAPKKKKPVTKKKQS